MLITSNMDSTSDHLALKFNPTDYSSAPRQAQCGCFRSLNTFASSWLASEPQSTRSPNSVGDQTRGDRHTATSRGQSGRLLWRLFRRGRMRLGAVLALVLALSLLGPSQAKKGASVRGLSAARGCWPFQPARNHQTRHNAPCLPPRCADGWPAKRSLHSWCHVPAVSCSLSGRGNTTGAIIRLFWQQLTPCPRTACRERR